MHLYSHEAYKNFTVKKSNEKYQEYCSYFGFGMIFDFCQILNIKVTIFA